MTLAAQIWLLLPLWVGYCFGSFAIGWSISFLWTYFKKLSEKI